MKIDTSDRKRPSKYNVVTNQQRNEIIEKLFNQKMKIREVAKFYDIPISTVKAVKQVYLKEGRIQKKAKRNRNKKVITTIIVAAFDKNDIPSDVDEIQKYTRVHVDHINDDEHVTEKCMKKGLDNLLTLLHEIKQSKPKKHSKMLSTLLKNYQQQCQTYD